MTKKNKLKKVSLLRWARAYKAYFFEESRRFDFTKPISVTVLAHDVEEALRLLRAEFPKRVLSGLHQIDNYREQDCGSECVLVAPQLSESEYLVPHDVRRRSIEERRMKWGQDRNPPSEVTQLRHLRKNLAVMGYSDAHPAMVEIAEIMQSYEPIPRTL